MKKCPYCDFNSHEITQSTDGYIDALLKDLDNDLSKVAGRQLQAIFIGGGTPSLMSADELEKLLGQIEQKIPFTHQIEITLEANPGTAEANKFKQFKQLGINRLSIGVQSFDDSLLQSIGRIHSGSQAKSAILMAQEAEIDQINIDLMYGLPNQSTQSMLDNLQTAINFKPNHLSHYQLTIEPNTYFAKHPPTLPDHDGLYQAEQLSKQLLHDNHYPQYEISAYSVCPSKHNMNYWQFGDYLGIGAGAHSKLTSPTGNIVRGVKPKSPKDYLKNTQGKWTTIAPEKIVFEFMLNALRLTTGFEKTLFEQRTGLSINDIKKPLEKAVDLGLLTQNKTLIKPTPRGFDFLNDLQSLFG